MTPAEFGPAAPGDSRRGLIAWFAHNPVAANLLMLLIIGTGLISVTTIRKEGFPAVEPQRIQISVPYPGAAPEEVEEGVVVKIEEALEGIDGIEEIRGDARESAGSIRIEVLEDADMSRVMDDVKIAVDGISTFPGETEKPVITRTLWRNDVLTVQLWGELDEASMKQLAERLRDEMLALPEVSQVEIDGARPFEISVEVSEAQLRRYDLTLEEIAAAIRTSSLDLPGGQIRTASGDIRLRTLGQAYTADEFARIVLLSDPDGTRVTVGDVAEVKDGFAETEFFSFFDGQRSIGLRVLSVGDQNEIEISRAVRTWLDERRETLPPGINIDYWGDITYYLQDRLDMMVENMALGALLVFVILGLLLRLQVAFWVILGLPVSFLGAFAMMQLPQFDVSINLLSLFGFILVLGIVVDDAIIIGESAWAEVEAEGYGIDNVVRGAQRVAMPATFGVLTTIATFMPLAFVSGPFERLAQSIAIVAIFALAFSLVESKLILPAHLTHLSPESRGTGRLRWLQDRAAGGLKRLVDDYYRPLLDRAVRHRWTTASIFLGMLLIAGGVVAGGKVRYVFFPQITTDMIFAEVEMTDGTPEELAVRILADMEARLQDVVAELREEYDGENPVRHTFAFLGGGTRGRLLVELEKNEDREIDPREVARRWREAVGEVAGTQRLAIYASRQTGGGPPVALQLTGRDYAELEAAAAALAEHLRTFDGTYEIETTATSGTRELQIAITQRGEALGLNQAALARQVRQAFYGAEAQRIQRGTDEVKVMVRYPPQARRSVGQLEAMWIRTPTGEEVPLASVASVHFDEAPASITRLDGRRAIRITANVDSNVNEPGRILSAVREDFMPTLKQRYPGVDWNLTGSSREERDTLGIIGVGGALAMFAIYALMAIPLKSYVQPLIIMLVIPFGIIGAVFGHLFMGMAVSIISLMGCIALAGVVVNDSLIMVDFVNSAVARGVPRAQAAVEAGTRRFRAILLTSLTTFFGLVPMLLETSVQAQVMIPMAVSLAFGILFATVITLILIPCLYVMLDDLRQLLQPARSRQPAPASAP